MKIAMMTNNYKPFVGGVPISVERQAKELAKLGHEVTVFAPEYGNGVQAKEMCKCESDAQAAETQGCENGVQSAETHESGNVRVIRFRTGKRCMENGMVWPKLILTEIAEVFESERFDLIHTHHPMFVGPTALYLGRKYHLPVVYTYHTRYEDYLHYLDFLQEDKSFPGFRRYMADIGKLVVVPKYMKWFTNRCDMVFAPAEGMLRRIRENGTETPMAVFPTGLEEEFYLEYPDEAAAIRRQYAPEGGVLFCTTGRLEAEKNPGFLLAGIRRLKEELETPFRVLVIGDGSMRAELEKEAEQMGIAENVCFLGNVSNERLNRYLQAGDVFLFASKSETQGIVLAEALAAGCPIVAVDASGVEDIVENGVNGYRTEEDVEVWADRVQAVLEQGAAMKERAKISAAAYRASRLACYEELLYRQCIAKKQADMQTDLDKKGEEWYGFTESRAKRASKAVYRIFKTS